MHIWAALLQREGKRIAPVYIAVRIAGSTRTPGKWKDRITSNRRNVTGLEER